MEYQNFKNYEYIIIKKRSKDGTNFQSKKSLSYYCIAMFQLNIISCAFIGSFLTTLAVDVWINSGLKYIVINTFRHAYNSEYLNVVVTGPFNSKGNIYKIMS